MARGNRPPYRPVTRQAHVAKYHYLFGLGEPDTSEPRTKWNVVGSGGPSDFSVVQDWRQNDETLRDEPYFRVDGPDVPVAVNAFDDPHEAFHHLAVGLGYENSRPGVYRMPKR